jgi:hypothetical protein
MPSRNRAHIGTARIIQRFDLITDFEGWLQKSKFNGLGERRAVTRRRVSGHGGHNLSLGRRNDIVDSGAMASGIGMLI